MPTYDPAQITHDRYIEAVTEVFANFREQLDNIERDAKNTKTRIANDWDHQPSHIDPAGKAIRELQSLTEHSTGRLLSAATDADYAARAAVRTAAVDEVTAETAENFCRHIHPDRWTHDTGETCDDCTLVANGAVVASKEA